MAMVICGKNCFNLFHKPLGLQLLLVPINPDYPLDKNPVIPACAGMTKLMDNLG